jgi:alkanesulfonate monooxygenase SsuD/methylene tetrahydromethanopterin reductase-like flavin-dependent oxidoreductase (luciferase family)
MTPEQRDEADRVDRMADALDEMRELLADALDYECEAFDTDSEVNGADLVEWFAEWRLRVREVIG